MARPQLIVKTREFVYAFLIISQYFIITHLIDSRNQVFDSIYNGSDEFCYTDLLSPDPRRTRSFLIHMIRFYTFKCEISKDFARVDSEIVSLLLDKSIHVQKKGDARIMRPLGFFFVSIPIFF